MTSDNDQRCSHCRHLNSANVLVCSLCGWALAKEGMELTYYPSTGENNEHMLASQQLFSQQQTHLLGATVSPDCHKSNSEKHDGMAHFKINEVLGQGGMGAVYRAQDLTLHRFVALKLFRTQLSSTCGNGQQLLDEARLACKLNHPNIVTIYDIARGQDCNFIVMEWIDGQSLDQLIPKNGMAVEKALEYLTQNDKDIQNYFSVVKITRQAISYLISGCKATVWIFLSSVNSMFKKYRILYLVSNPLYCGLLNIRTRSY